MLYFKLYPFNFSSSLVVSHSYLCIWVNNCSIISHVIIYLKVLKRWISILNLALFSSTLPVTLLIVDLSPSHFFCFGLLRTSSCSACCRLISISIFVALVSSTPRVPLLIVDLFQLSEPFLLCIEHLDSLCSLFSCLWRRSKYLLSLDLFL